MRKIRSVKVLGLAAVLAAAAGVALAQSGDDDRRGWGMGRMTDGPMMGWRMDGMLDRIDGRLAFMKTELQITEAQNEQWQDFAETVRNNAETHNDMMRVMMEEMHSGAFFEKPLPDRLIQQETFMEARLEEIKALRVSLDELYAVLNEDQKKAADEIVLPMMGMGHGMMRGRGPGMMWR